MKEKNEKKLSYGTYSLEDTAKKLGVIPQTLRNWMIQIGLHNPVPKKYSLIKEYPIEVSRSALNRLIEYKNFKEKKIKVIIDEQASTLMGYASRSQLVVKLKKQFTKFNPERYKSSFFFTEEEIAWGILYRKRVKELNRETARKYTDLFKERRERGITEEEYKKRMEQIRIQKREKLPDIIKEIYEKEILPRDLGEREKWARAVIKEDKLARQKEEEERDRRWREMLGDRGYDEGEEEEEQPEEDGAEEGKEEQF